MDILLQRITCSNQYDVPKDASLVVDGQALVVALGKPQSLEIITFGDFAKSYCEYIFQHGGRYARIDVVFDRYVQPSIKDGTRSKRAKRTAIRRVIENDDVPLPQDWNSFLSEPQNKADLALYLSHKLMDFAPEEKCVITGGGLAQAEEVISNRVNLNLTGLSST